MLTTGKLTDHRLVSTVKIQGWADLLRVAFARSRFGFGFYLGDDTVERLLWFSSGVFYLWLSTE